MNVLPLLFMALALTSAAAALKINVAGVDKDGKAVNFEIVKAGVYEKNNFVKISDLVFDSESYSSKDPPVFAICGLENRPNKGPTAMVFTPAIMDTSFFKRQAVNTEFARGFQVLPLSQIDQLCEAKEEAKSGILLKLVNDWKPKSTDKSMPTHAVLFRKTTIFAVHRGFQSIVQMNLANNNVNEDYTVYLCHGGNKVTTLKSNQKDVVAAGILAVEIVAKSGKPAEGGKPCHRFLK